jgi:hypothetical protein
VRLNIAMGDPLFQGERFWDLPSKFVESISKKLIEQQWEAANIANFSAATSAALLNCIIARLGGNKSEFDPMKFLPCTVGENANNEPDDFLEVNRAALQLFFTELEAKRVPGWVFSALSNNFDHWRKQIS